MGVRQVIPDAFPLLFYTIIGLAFLAVISWLLLNVQALFRKPKEPKPFPWPEDENT